MVMEKNTMQTDGLFIKVEKYFINGNLTRVLIKSPEENYLLDLTVHSFFERLIVLATVIVIKTVSLVLPTFHTDINKIIC
jgi:hypothetical protein